MPYTYEKNTPRYSAERLKPQKLPQFKKNLIMKHFNWNEFEWSDTAIKKNISNKIPNYLVKSNILKLVDRILDPLRENLGCPIIISSGYRCPELNKLVGGVKNSQHTIGQAADITFQYKDIMLLTAYERLQTSPFKEYIDQCIYYEKKGFIHISISENPRHQYWIQL